MSGHCGPEVTQQGEGEEGEGRVRQGGSPSKQGWINVESCRAKTPTFKSNEIKLQAPTLKILNHDYCISHGPQTVDVCSHALPNLLHPKAPMAKRARVLQVGPGTKVDVVSVRGGGTRLPVRRPPIFGSPTKSGGWQM